MGTGYLVPLVTHLNWHGVLENFLASCSLQQFQVKPGINTCELKRLSSWQTTTKYLQKLKCRLFTLCFNRANDRAKFDYRGRRKKLLSFRLCGLMTWWFPKTVTLEVLTKEVVHFDQLTALAKNDVNRGLLLCFF